MRKTQKLIMAILLMALAMQFAPTPSAFSANEVLFKTQVDVGYWDIWLHSDGVTWQYTGKPGDEKSYTFAISPPPETANYDNVRHEIKAGITKEQFMAAGGRGDYAPDEAGWDEFDREILVHIPDDYRQTGDNQVTFTLSPKMRAKWIKEEWQADMVEGWRWYLPVTINWYGVPKTEKPKPKAGGFYNIDDYLGLKSGDFRTFTYNHEKIGNGGTVIFKIYKFTTEIGNVISQYQMPPDAELWKTETITFRPGWDKWTIDLPVRYPEHGEEVGYFITSSEKNFERGVIVSAAADHEVHALNRGSNRDNWHAGDDFVGFFTHEGQALDLKTEGVQRYIERWENNIR